MTNPARDEDAVVVKFTETVSTLALLNLYWLISSLLIVPFFASTEALFYCVNRHVENREVNLRPVFFNYVKTHLASSLKRLWLPVLILFIAFADTLVIYYMPLESVSKSLLLGVFIVSSLFLLFMFYYDLTFSAAKQSDKETLKQRGLRAFYTVLRYPHFTVGLLLVLVIFLLVSLYFVPLLFFFSLSFPAYCFTLVTLTKLNKKSHRMD